jgi:hypothetical protein
MANATGREAPTTPKPTEPPAANPTTPDEAIGRLEAENRRLRAQLAAAGRPAGAATPAHTFQLSEGDRQELEIRGVINYGGRVMTKADVEKAMREAGQEGVEIADAPAETKVAVGPNVDTGPGVRGIDFVYPSVARGQIDPAVAGTPGISGPAADAK